MTVKLLSTFQQLSKKTRLEQSTAQVQQRTEQYTLKTQQARAKTTQTTKTTLQTTKTMEQFVLATSTLTRTQFQRQKTTSQITKITEQYQQQTRQDKMQTLQTTKTVTQTTKVTQQYQVQTKQFWQTTTQYMQGQTHYTLAKSQTLKRVYQIIARDAFNETRHAGRHLHGGGWHHLPHEGDLRRGASRPGHLLGWQQRRTQLHQDDVPGWRVDASRNTGHVLHAGTTTSGDWVISTCKLIVDQPVQAVASCSPLGTSQSSSSPYTITTCTQPAGNNNKSAAVASCTLGTTAGNAGNSWVTTVCSNPAGPNNQTSYVLSCTVGTTSSGAPNYVTTTCSQPAGHQPDRLRRQLYRSDADVDQQLPERQLLDRDLERSDCRRHCDVHDRQYRIS